MNTMKRKIKNIFKNPNQISRDEKLIIDIKIHWMGLMNSTQQFEKKLSALEDIETAKNETHTKKRQEKNEQCISGLYINTNWPNTCIIGVTGGSWEGETEKYFNKKCLKFVPIWRKL